MKVWLGLGQKQRHQSNATNGFPLVLVSHYGLRITSDSGIPLC